MRRWTTILGMLLTSTCGAALAADPPPTLDYRAVLWDPAGRPRTGTFDMTFRFSSFDLYPYWDELLIDSHTAGGAGAVMVTDGLLSVTLGGGAVTDGSGPGTYTSLADVFRDHGDVFMEISIGTEVLVPMVQIQSSAYALNSGSLQGRLASSFLDTSSTAQTKSSPLTVISSTADAITGVSAGGVTGVLGSADYYSGVAAYGGPVGGFFTNTSGSSATIANYAEGVQVVGQSTAGSFTNLGGSGQATLASGNTGLTAYGTLPGGAGHFQDRFYDGSADLAKGNFGVAASGSYIAGRFFAADNFGNSYLAELGSDNWGAAGFFYWYSSSGQSIETLVATGSGYGVTTNGPKDFVQNHPTDPDRLITYSVLEGPEAGTYTRGSGSIRGAEARIALEPTFALTTDPDVGLTAVVTARGPRADLYVASVSTKELVVRSGAPSADAVTFDYVVNGLRVGFEHQPVILESRLFPNATVPSLEASAATLAALPEDARASTPLARFAAERAHAGLEAQEPSGARAMIAGIDSPEHALHARAVDMGRHAATVRAKDAPSPVQPAPASRATPPGPAGPASRSASAAVGEPSSRARDASPAFTGQGGDAPTEFARALSMPIEMEVQAGDVLSSDPSVPGTLRFAEETGEAAVIGIVVGPAGSRFWGQAPIALAGTVVPCNVDASVRPIAVSDLLVVSPTPGVAMSAGADPGARTVIGKALDPLAAGTGSIRILVLSR